MKQPIVLRALLVLLSLTAGALPAWADYRRPAKLNLSTRIPAPGEELTVTVNVRSQTAYEGVPVTLFTGQRPGADGAIVNPLPIASGVIQGGRCVFTFTCPGGAQVGQEFYLGAVVRAPNDVYLSEVQGLTTIPTANDADWIVEPDGYTEVQSGLKTLTGKLSPIVGAFDVSQPGDVILVRRGEYTDPNPMSFSDPPSGSSQRRYVIAEDAREVTHDTRIKRLPYSGSPTVQLLDLNNVTFVGFHIEATQWGILWGSDKRGTSGVSFLETIIDGGYDFYTNSGFCSKWGVQGKNSSDMLFRGGYIHDVCQEHAFYIQNQTGDLTIENVYAERFGRTFLQTTSRISEGLPGRGLITVRNVWVREAGLEGNCWNQPTYDGGSALTFTGRHNGESLVDNVNVSYGFDGALNLVAGFPIGTGAFVSWLGNDVGNAPNGPIRVQNCQFRVGPGAGDRANMQIIGGTVLFTFLNSRVDHPWRTGPNSIQITQPADTLVLDPSLTGKAIKGRLKYYGQSFRTYRAFLQSGLLNLSSDPKAAWVPTALQPGAPEPEPTPPLSTLSRL